MKPHLVVGALLMGALLHCSECRAQSGWKPDTIKIGTISNLWDVKFIDELRGVVVGDTLPYGRRRRNMERHVTDPLLS